MSKTRTQIEQKCKSNLMVYDVSKWTYKCKTSKKIWYTIQWMYKNNLLSEKGINLFKLGYKGSNGILKITTLDLTPDGNSVMKNCYSCIGDKVDKVETILSRCFKKMK